VMRVGTLIVRANQLVNSPVTFFVIIEGIRLRREPGVLFGKALRSSSWGSVGITEFSQYTFSHDPDTVY
jgi:hypothetical protein